MLPIDLPTLEQFKRLSQARADACVSIYLETDPLTQKTDAARIERANCSRPLASSLSRLTSTRRGSPRSRSRSMI